MAKKSKELKLDMDAINNQHIIDVDLNSEMKKAYIDYAMSVIVSRALPDVRDGMKPVHRRILYDMYEANLLYENDFKKSAATVGDVLGKYHPHGDASVYDAMVRLAQDFSLRYPLVQGKGNFGSVDGDPPAAYRYTEAKMSKISALMLTDIEKNTVDYVPNYDDKLKEPDVLPSRFPNLLVNGSAGIAVGMATNIPPHNLTEVVDGIIAVIDDPMITTEELMTHIQGPDFPTGGVIMGKSGIRNAYTTGRGKIILRAKAEIEEHNDRNRIVVTEIPYQVNKAKLEKHINELVRDGKIDGISSTRDESTEHIRLVIELKRDANPNVVLNNLFKYTQMQDTFGIILLALVDKQPKILTLREMIDYYIAHQEDVISRRTQFELDKALDRAHILEGYKIVIDNVDEVIKIIRASKSIPDAKQTLCERFSLTDAQSDAIVKMQLGRLSGMERDKIEEEYQALVVKIEDLRSILADESKVLEIIKNDLTDIKNKYGDERRTEISAAVGDVEDEDLIPVEDCILTLTEKGYMKRQTVDTYKAQNRGGRGVSGMSRREEDVAKTMFSCSTHDFIMLFTNKGKVFKMKGYEIPESSRTGKGMNIVNILPVEQGEQITAMVQVPKDEERSFLCMMTKNGIIKRTSLDQYDHIRKSGIIAINLDEGDELSWVEITDGKRKLVAATHDGMSICFEESDARLIGRTARGVKAITLGEGDYVVGFAIEREGVKLLTVSETGYGRKSEFSDYRVQSRGGK